MYAVFSVLFIIAIIILIWVLVAPKSLSGASKQKISRKKSAPALVIIALTLLILSGATAPKQPQNKTVQLQTTNSKSTVTAPKQTKTEKTLTQTKPVPFTSTTVQDSSLAKGTTKTTTQGVNGIETLTYQDTYTNGKQTDQKLISDVVTTKPVTQVTSVGTYVAPAPTTPAPAPSTTPSTTSSCTPLTNGGNCYEPGEYCRDSDHGASGVAGDGESITCLDNNGWRWEPS